MTLRRSALCVPASEPTKISKALGLTVDEVIVDLEDAVAPARKDEARGNLTGLNSRRTGSISVRVNAADTQWYRDDIRACAANKDIDTIVIPKAEDPALLRVLDRELAALEAGCRTTPLGVQILIESAKGLAGVQDLAMSSPRIEALIIGYADLGASLGRTGSASWQYVQETVVLAARLAGIQAIDGPQLTVDDGLALSEASAFVKSLGFDGKWVIHPRQFQSVQSVFTPDEESVQEARELLAAMDEAVRLGQGAVQWRGRMLDEAVAIQARRLVSQAVVS